MAQAVFQGAAFKVTHTLEQAGHYDFAAKCAPIHRSRVPAFIRL